MLIAQGLSALVMTALLFAGGHDPGVMSAYLLLLLANGIASARRT